MVTRLLEYLVRLWTEPATPGSLSIACVCGVALDLTGRSPAREINLRSAVAPGCRLELTVLRRHLADEDAAMVVAGVTAGTVSPWLLPWVPLMQRGGEADIIEAWLAAAEPRFSSQRDRADLGILTRVFATRAGCRPAWDNGLQGWKMNLQTSPIFDEARALIRAEERAQARAEAMAEARAQAMAEARAQAMAEVRAQAKAEALNEARKLILRVGRRKFRKAPTKKQQQLLEALNELPRLEALAEHLLAVDSWAELLSDV